MCILSITASYVFIASLLFYISIYILEFNLINIKNTFTLLLFHLLFYFTHL